LYFDHQKIEAINHAHIAVSIQAIGLLQDATAKGILNGIEIIETDNQDAQFCPN
jgi:hypothetical protein